MEHLWGCTRGWAGKNPGGNYCLLHWPRGLCCSSVCIHCSPAAQNAALGHCCSPVHPPAAALVHLTLSWVTAAALCVHPLQPCCTECCLWSLLQPCASTCCSSVVSNVVLGHCCSSVCTHCSPAAPNIALGHCCSSVHPPAAALVHQTLPLVTAAALCLHPLHCWCT